MSRPTPSASAGGDRHRGRAVEASRRVAGRARRRIDRASAASRSAACARTPPRRWCAARSPLRTSRRSSRSTSRRRCELVASLKADARSQEHAHRRHGRRCEGGLPRAAAHTRAQLARGTTRPARSSSTDYVNLGIAAATERGLIVPEHPRCRRAEPRRAGRRDRRARRDGARGQDAARRHDRRHVLDHQRRRLRRRRGHADPQSGRGRRSSRSARCGAAVGVPGRDRAARRHDAEPVVRPPAGRRRAGRAVPAPMSGSPARPGRAMLLR